MEDGLVLLRLHGLDARNGRVPTEAFAGLIRKFAATLAVFERTFTSRHSRSTDLNVATLGRENPLVVGLRPESRVRGYSPFPAIAWTFEEIARIGNGLPPDEKLPIEAFDGLVSLSDSTEGDREQLADFSAAFNGCLVGFDSRLATSAKTKRHEAISKIPTPIWFAGVSKGELLGELRGVVDLHGEREFYIRLMAQNRIVQCIFPEAMRQEMEQLLFQPVRLEGFLHFDGSGPHARLVDATKISALDEDNKPHLSDHQGIFQDSYYPSVPELPQ